LPAFVPIDGMAEDEELLEFRPLDEFCN